MGKFTKMMVATAQRSQGFAEKAAADVPAEKFARKPAFDRGETIVDCNHPAFVYGHLALYPARIAAMLGLDAKAVAAPAGFEELFKAGVECRDDTGGNIYPSKEAILAAFKHNYAKVLEMVAEMPDERLDAETAEERYRAIFPQVGAMANFMLNNHVMMHLGQVSTWRRCMGLKSVM